MTIAAANVPARSALARLATERNLALGSLGLVGLHVVDDNFLQPEPGMSPVDHLPGGLTQLALVVAAAWAYPRLRAGARAALALLFGFFGVLAGTESVYYTFADRPSGDDFTGFLSLVAGFVLLGIGIRTLWQSRRTDDSRRRRYLRRGLITAGVARVDSRSSSSRSRSPTSSRTRLGRSYRPRISARRTRTSASRRATACGSRAGSSPRATARP